MGGITPSSEAKVFGWVLAILSAVLAWIPSFCFWDEESTPSVVQDAVIKLKAISVAELNLFFIFFRIKY